MCVSQAPFVQKAINANLGLKVNHGFCFSCKKALPLLVLSYSLKAAKVNIEDKTNSNLQEFTSLIHKTECKIDAYHPAMNNSAQLYSTHNTS